MIKVLWKLWRIYAHTVGIIFMVFSLYAAIKLSIIYHPVDIDSDSITKVEIFCIDTNKEKSYKIVISEQSIIKELVKRTNSLKVTEGTSSEEYDYLITVSFKNDMEFNYPVRVCGSLLVLGEESYKLRKNDKKDYIEYIKYLIEESDNCIVEDR